jgi:exosortase A-associated hydrolase 1
MTSSTERAITFDCSGEQCLGIIHDAANASSRVGVLVVVGGPQYRVGSHRQFVHMARHLAAKGHPVLRFDYRGMGDSTGEGRDFRAVSSDIRAAIDAFVGAVPGLRSVVIFGLCDAASAALMYCNSDDRVAGLILANPWVRTESGLAQAQVKHYYGGRLLQGSFWRKLRSGRLKLIPAARSFIRAIAVTVRRRIGGLGAAPDADFVATMRRGLEGFSGPVLLVMSGRDLTAKEFSDLCVESSVWARLLTRANVSVQAMASADHTFSTRVATEQVNSTCSQWLRTVVPSN